jgi:acyl transferase domain-containing protein/NAD(P)-dependent dehydrogenase (short-subunit alcohol dehydrogenase family)/acyl carrier protein
MGEGAAILVLKRLADAERDGDKIYSVIRGMGGASDGKGKGITAPNPIGQMLAVQRGWENAGVSPATATLIEGHGTSTRVGDVVETESMIEVLKPFHLPVGSVALGSVKSNIGHLKSAAGAAGLLKTIFALHERVVPPSINCQQKNSAIDFDRSPLRVNQELRDWTMPQDQPRRAGVSAFGFGGTNFHAVLEDYVPGRIKANGKNTVAVNIPSEQPLQSWATAHSEPCGKRPLRGALVLGAKTQAELAERLRVIVANAEAGKAPASDVPAEADLRAPERLAIDYADAAELSQKSAKALQALTTNHAGMWKALRAKGVFRGSGQAPKVAFLYTGQGSQYVNMLQTFRETEPVVAQTFAEADQALRSLLGKPLSKFIFVDRADKAAIARAEEDLRQTAITQPAVLATDIALTRMLALYGIQPDMTMGHSLGEYGALVAAGVLPFNEALEAVSARGREMTRVSVGDHGRMAAVNAPLDRIEQLLKSIDGYVVIANLNSTRQAVIGGASEAVGKALDLFHNEGIAAVELHVSHAFHTSIVAPASDPLRLMLHRHNVQPPRLPVIANVTGEFYPSGSDVVPQIVDLLARQVAAPVQFVKGLQTLHAAGARLFVELGPKKALQGFVDDVFGDDPQVVSLFTNHPKLGDAASFNQALCGFYAAGLGAGRPIETRESEAIVETRKEFTEPERGTATPMNDNHRNEALGRMFAEFIDRASEVLHGGRPSVSQEPVGITGAALGLPGTARTFDDDNVARILRGDQFIDAIPQRLREAMLDKNVTRLVKSENVGPTFESIHDLKDVIKLAGRGKDFDLEKDFGVPADRMPALDRVTRLAMAAGIDALRDAGIPLVLRYKTTTKGTQLPDRWALPDSLRDNTGIIFASAFPGYNALIEDLSHYYEDHARRTQLAQLESVRTRLNGNESGRQEVDRRIAEIKDEIAHNPYVFDRRFLFKVLSMGHSQFAEFIGARGPNTQVNTACASTTQALVIAEDWIHAGRCKRVVVITADDVTSDNMLEWIGAGFLATGAAATDEKVEDAAIPFDRRRHGMLIGMGAAAFVVESAEAARERGIQPICEVLSTVTANSAFHGTRLDVEHIGDMMERLVHQAESERGIRRHDIASQLVFVSHETYTPARGGSASAEINALRRVFGNVADRIVIANTKGYTGHPMGTGIEDAVAVKVLETGIVPPVANFKEVDPELGALNLSKGGAYPVQYALRLAAGFGSQISMTLLHWIRTKDGVRPAPNSLGYQHRIVDSATWKTWLTQIAGHPTADLEVVYRTLRVRDNKIAAQATTPPEIQAKPEVKAPVITTPTPQADPVKQRILALVAEKTGYPSDMLDLDLDLEADLGVDTVKQAEVFAAVREAYGIPRDEKLKLRDFPTLKHVIGFVHEHRPDLAAATAAVAATAVPVAAPVVETKSEKDPVEERILDLAVEKTGYPRDMLDLDLDLEADLGVDTVKQAEMFAAIREIYNIPREENRKLRDYPTLAHVIRYVREKRPDLAVSAAPATVTATPAPSAPDGSIKDKVLDIVALQTGYPKEMLDLDLDLEADLGIDTVKQAEMFAAVRAAYNIPRDQNLKLRDFPTLAHVIRFAEERQSGALPQPVEIAARPAQTAQHIPVERPLAESFDAAEQIPRRVPVAVLRPDLSICKSTGVTLERGKRVLIVSDKGGGAKALAKRLKSLGVEVFRLETSLSKDEFVEQLNVLTAEQPLHGVYWLPALDAEDNTAAMDLAAWREGLRIRVKLLFSGMRALYEQIAPAGTFLVSATRLGGQHGYDPAGAVAPLGGAVSGFTKTYKRERPDATVKVVDFGAEAKPSEIAETLIEETLRDPGAVEIGHQGGLRWTVSLEQLPVKDGHAGLTLDAESVFVVTGAAGSIVSAIVTDLAAASGGTFYLLDLVPEPDANNPDIKRFLSDKEGLKRDLFARIQQRGERATPAMVERELAALERAHAALSAIEAVRAAGGTAHYFSTNLTNAESVASAIEQVRERSGRIDVLLHAAGLERSHFLPDKDPREFDLVFDVKADGWFNLLRAIGDMPVAATVAFSSIAGRFGNAGQTDYSSANDLLCKFASSFRTTRPSTRGIAIDWTAWGGIGMATRGSIPKMMEVAHIDMLPPEAGIPWIRRELTEGGTRGEVVVGQRLGVLLNEWDAEGGVDIEATLNTVSNCGPMVDGIAGMPVYHGLSAKALLDPMFQSFLHDHQIDRTPVLPGVMGIEAFAETAASILPDWNLADVEDVNFLAPFKFYRGEPRTVTTEAMFRRDGEALVADCRLIGTRHLPNQPEPQLTTHFTGRVRLTKAAPSAAVSSPPAMAGDATVDAASIYNVYFHGPAYRVLHRAWRDGKRIVGEFAMHLPADREPTDCRLLMTPRLIELCFQTAGLWEIATDGRMGLPQHVERVSVLATPEEGTPVYAVVTPHAGTFDAEVVDATGKRYVAVTGYRTITLPERIDPQIFKALQPEEECEVIPV